MVSNIQNIFNSDNQPLLLCFQNQQLTIAETKARQTGLRPIWVSNDKNRAYKRNKGGQISILGEHIAKLSILARLSFFFFEKNIYLY